ncbi:signal peptidase I [Kitasatospora mediocidica]|uniref:signal peptidase I n=1 Tax=Kitasatospora mediocidica TaxID=58352 RepID=UPI00055AB1A4|nr:signal peptidase I [Kitasatospora mediocidica]
MGDLVIGARSGAGEPEGSGNRTAQSTESAEPSEPGDDSAADRRGPAEVPEEPVEREKPPGERKQRSFWKELPILIGIALVLALVIKTFFVQAFSIPSESMQNTLQVGDRVLVDKLTPWFGSTPDRGEVVVFHDPGGWLNDEPSTQSSNSVIRGFQDVLSFIGLMPSANEKDLIKRVIGVGGDTVQCNGTGPLMVNGVALDEPYIYPGATACGTKPFGPIKVPPNSIWVMGDHRDDSLDSRFHMDQPGGGSVPDKDVIGRAFVVAWPLNRWSTLPIPSTFSQKGISNQKALSAEGMAPPLAAVGGALPFAWWVRRRRN